MFYAFAAIAVVWFLSNLWWAIKSREYRKFLSGAFFVSWGMQVYFYFAKVSVPLLGTSFVFTPEISLWRSFPYLVFCVLCTYYGFIQQPKGAPSVPR
jgi:hypothetical protein